MHTPAPEAVLVPEAAPVAKPPLEALFEAIEGRGRPLSAATWAWSARMVEAVARLQEDPDARAIALEMVTSVAMVMIGDAQKATKLLADKKVSVGSAFLLLGELGDLAAIFARTRHEDVYDSVCRTMAGLRSVVNRDGPAG